MKSVIEIGTLVYIRLDKGGQEGVYELYTPKGIYGSPQLRGGYVAPREISHIHPRSSQWLLKKSREAGRIFLSQSIKAILFRVFSLVKLIVLIDWERMNRDSRYRNDTSAKSRKCDSVSSFSGVMLSSSICIPKFANGRTLQPTW